MLAKVPPKQICAFVTILGVKFREPLRVEAKPENRSCLNTVINVELPAGGRSEGPLLNLFAREGYFSSLKSPLSEYDLRKLG